VDIIQLQPNKLNRLSAKKYKYARTTSFYLVLPNHYLTVLNT
jgi:hypothetical protein